MTYLIEDTDCFKSKDICKNSKGEYTNLFGTVISTASFRIAWKIAAELSDNPTMTTTDVANYLNDIMEQLEETNGGRFE